MSIPDALTNSDILSLIFECFSSASPTTPKYGAALARAARVCIAFHEPAIRLLWRNLDSPVPLLSLLPSSFTRVGEADRDVGGVLYDTYMLSGNVDRQEWEHMRRRAEYVQTLDFESFNSHKRIAPATWAYLAHLTHDRPLLPYLRRLRGSLRSPQATITICPLLSPNLTDLSIHCIVMSDVREWECSLRSLFHMVCSIATGLDQLRFSTAGGSPLPLSIFSPIQQLKCLRTIDCGSMSSEIDFQSLRSVFFGLKTLEYIHLPMDYVVRRFVDLRPQVETPLGSTLGLSNLHTLHIRNLRPTIDVNLYHIFSSSTLRELRDSFHGISNVDESRAIVATIAHCFPCLQVLYLRLEFRRGLPIEGFSPGVVAHSLSKLHAMVSLKLAVSGLPDASTDRGIHALVEAWPLLTSLHIDNDNPLVAALTPAVLVSLASRCPQLETVFLPSLGVPEREFLRLADYPILDHSLRKLSFRVINVTDHRYTALLFDRLFPRLDLTGDIRNEPCMSAQSYPVWTQVCDELEALQAARRQHEQRLGVGSLRRP